MTQEGGQALVPKDVRLQKREAEKKNNLTDISSGRKKKVCDPFSRAGKKKIWTTQKPRIHRETLKQRRYSEG